VKSGSAAVSDAATCKVRPLPPRSRKTNAAMRKADMPLITNAIGHIVTRVVNAHAAGDHTPYIGEVEHLDFVDDDPLLFFAGKYRQLALVM
jgi:flavin reductase (DIM6/NTAB) family NADH-FMN oxidoreductase RutF